MLPLFFRKGCKALVVGGGRVALRKVGALLRGGAHITVTAPQFCSPLKLLAQAQDDLLTLESKTYSSGSLDMFDLVFACTDNPATNEQVAVDARRSRVPVNTADNPAMCDFFMPAVSEVLPSATVENMSAAEYQESPQLSTSQSPSVLPYSVVTTQMDSSVVLAVGCGGVPALAAALRDKLVECLPANIADYAAALSMLRNADSWRGLDSNSRRVFMLRLVEMVLDGDARISGFGTAEVMQKIQCILQGFSDECAQENQE